GARYSDSDLSACSSPSRSAKRLVFPEPFAPIRPILSPGLSAASAPSSSVLAPRRSVTWERRIMSVRFARRALYAEPLGRRARYLASVLLMEERTAWPWP